MKLPRNSDIRIAKGVIDSVFTKNPPLDYHKWVEFVDSHSDVFIWNENTVEGQTLKNSIDSVPEAFRERALQSLNKVSCYSEWDANKGYYNINFGWDGEKNWIRIGFERTPKAKDLAIFLAMANHLDALLLLEGKIVIDEKLIKENRF